MYRWLLYTCAAFRELWRTNPWDPRATLLFLKTNRLGHVLFPSARWQHCWYAQTALCIPDILCCFDCVLTVFDDWYSVPFVKNSQKTVKIAKMTIGVPIVTCLHSVRRIHKAAQTPLPCETSIARAWAVATAVARGQGRADCMCLHGRPCVWLPFAAACSCTLFYLLMMPAARLVCQRLSTNLPYFRTPLANF